jgi:multidrug efflux pump subunit AcrA (membrane-fusion protein)
LNDHDRSASGDGGCVNIRVSWHMLGLALLVAAAVVAAMLELGPPSSSARTSRELVTAARGIVQSTVTGTGNVEPGIDVNADFQTSGTLQNVYVKAGDQVVKGQLLATLDPAAAQLTLDQAQQNLTSAQDQLANAESASASSSTTTSLEGATAATDFVSFTPTTTRTSPTTTTATTTTSATTSTTPTTTSTTTSTTPTTTSTTTSTTPSGSRGGRQSTGSTSGASGASGASGTSGTSGTNTTSADTIAANIASAQASVDGAEATVQNAETALHETHLYAPAGGTVVSVQATPLGSAVSGSGSSTGSSSSNSGSSSSSSAGSTSAGSLGGSSSSSSSTSSTGFIEIVNTRTLTMTVAFSESDIGKVKVGQPANVTLDALSGVELAAHVTSISTLGTTSSSVVSYDATLTLNQRDSRVKPGMSASAAVITGQASGVNLPNSAVTGTGSVSRVNVMRNGKQVSAPIVVGLVGDSRTQIVSGLSAGQQVVVTTTLPSLSSSSAGSSSSGGTLGGATGAGGTGGLGGGAARRLFGGGGGGFTGGG